MSRGQRMTPAEAREYWRAHEERFSDIDWERDPDGLAGYLGPGEPQWLNERHAALQRSVFDQLLDQVAPPAEGSRALDVGCGAGRWTRRLADRGYQTVGLDLQERIIAANRVRFPEIEWHAVPLQDLPHDGDYSVVTAVGVLDMIPFDDQPDVIKRIAGVLAPEGRVLVIAALKHPSPNAFPHTADGWRDLFAGADLRPEAELSFGWEPLRRAAAGAVRAFTSSRHAARRVPTEAAPLDPAQPGGAVRRVPRGMRVIARFDDRLERPLQRLQPPGAHSRFIAFLLAR